MPPRVWAVLGVILGAIVVPFITLHALLLHFTDMGHTGLDRWLGDPGLIGVTALIIVSSLSTTAVLVAALQWRAQAGRLSSFAEGHLSREICGIPAVVIPGDEVILFAAGARRSRMFVSEGAVASLTRDQLHAALLHERAHIERRDVAWRSGLAVIDKAFGRLPGVAGSVRQLALRAECQADRRAIAMGAERRALFEAIVAAAGAPSALPSLGGVAVLPRLERIADSQAPLPRVPILGPIVVGAWLTAPPILAHLAILVGFVCASRL